MAREFSINRFYPHINGEERSAWGQIVRNEADVNMSSIYSKLIFEAGRWCESYASDILYDIKAIEDKIFELSLYPGTASFLLGFRQNGVDGTDSIRVKYENPSTYGYLSNEYRSIYRLDLVSDENHIEGKLYRVII